jgi:hypothetical protein
VALGEGHRILLRDEVANPSLYGLAVRNARVPLAAKARLVQRFLGTTPIGQNLVE